MFRWHTLTMRTGLEVDEVENAIHEHIEGQHYASDVYVEEHGPMGAADQIVVTLTMNDYERREALESFLHAHSERVDVGIVLTADNTTDEAEVEYYLHDGGEMEKVDEDGGIIHDNSFEYDGVKPRSIV